MGGCGGKDSKVPRWSLRSGVLTPLWHAGRKCRGKVSLYIRYSIVASRCLPKSIARQHWIAGQARNDTTVRVSADPAVASLTKGAGDRGCFE